MVNPDLAQKYANDKHQDTLKKDGITTHMVHLESVVSRLKGLGIVDEDILCAGWLHDTMEKTDTTFDELYERFGQNVSTIVMSLSKDKKLPKKEKESQYTQQLKHASFDAKMIKLCDISANLREIVNSDLSKTKKRKLVNQLLHYLRIIKNDLSKNQIKYPGIRSLVNGINQIVILYGQKPIVLDT